MRTFRPWGLVFALPVLLVIAQCASPPVKPLPPEEPVIQPQPVVEIDDDHRLVSLAEFEASPWKSLGAIMSVVREGNGFSFGLEGGRTASLTFLTSRNFRIWFPPATEVSPASPGQRDWPTGAVEVRLVESPEALEFTTPALKLTLDRSTLAWTVKVGDAAVFRTTSGPVSYKRRLLQTFVPTGAPLWTGLGSAGSGVTKVGQTVKLWTRADNSEGSGPWPVPFLLGAGGSVPMGLLVDNSYQSYVGLKDDSGWVGTLNGGLDLVFWAGTSVGDVVKGLTSLVGRPDRAPDAALTVGLKAPAPEAALFVRGARLSVGQAVVPGLGSEARALLTSAHFLPVDAATPSVGPGFDPTDGKAVLGPTGPSALPALFPPTDWNRRFEDRGRNSLLARVGNFWATSATEGWARAARASAGPIRPWLTWTTGSTGASRWGAPEILATAGGDDRVWLDRMFSAGVSGLGTAQLRLDIRPLADATANATTSAAAWRSLQAALLVPYLVLEAGPEPQVWWNSLSTKDKKQFKFMLDRRSTLKPVLVAAAAQTSVSGAPAVRPLFWSYPTDPKARVIADEFLLGDGVLVAPALDGKSTRKVYLPVGGVWFQFPAGEEYGAGQTYDLPTSPDFPLVFVKAGSFTPTREAEVYDEKATFNPLTYHVYPGAAGMGLYEVDDGTTTDRERGLMTLVNFSFSAKANTMQIDSEVDAAGPRMKYSDPYILLRLHKVYNPKSVKIDGKVIPKYGDSFGITDTDRSAAWYETDNTLLIKLFAPDKGQTIDLEFAKAPPGP